MKIEHTTKQRYQIAREKLDEYHKINVKVIRKTKVSNLKDQELKREQRRYDKACDDLFENFNLFGGLFYNNIIYYKW